jgi:outer membrane protein assembly factor BamB
VTDFLAELRRELVDAHAAHARRGRRHRAWRGVRRLLGLGRFAVAVTVTASLLAAIVVMLARDRPAERSQSPKVVATLEIDGLPVSAAHAGGSLWVADASGKRLVEIDARTRQVLARIPLAGAPTAVTASRDDIWIRSGRDGSDMTDATLLDASSGETLARAELGPGTPLATSGDAAWGEVEATDDDEPQEGLYRVDANTSRRKALTGAATLDAAGKRLWALRTNGELVALDATTGRVLERHPGLLPISVQTPGSHALAADAQGVWALGRHASGEAELVRVQDGEVIARHRIASALALLAADDDAVWVATDGAGGSYRLQRLDPRTGAPVAAVSLRGHRPIALEITATDVWAFGADGTATLVER